MSKDKIKVGQSVWVTENDPRYKKGLQEFTVTKVGRLYFETSAQWHGKFDFDKMVSHSGGFSGKYSAYTDPQEYIDEQEKLALLQELQKMFSWQGDSKKLSLNQLKQIKAIATP